MMLSPDLERFATLIADNVVSAVERYREDGPVSPTQRVAVISALVRSLLAVLPTASGDALTAACNRGLDDVVAAIGPGGSRVEAVDPSDGSVMWQAR